MKRIEMIQQLADILSDQERGHPLRVGIDGVDAAGKTTFADELAKVIQRRNVIRASVDGFHRPAIERYRRGRLSPEGYYRDSFNHEQLINLLLNPLGSGGDLRYRTAVFDYRTDSPVDAPLKKACPDDILLFDGVFLMRPELRGFWDVAIFVDAPFSATVPRAMRRGGDSEEARTQYAKRYIPGQKLYFKEAKPQKKADIIIDNSDFDHPTMRVLKSLKTPLSLDAVVIRDYRTEDADQVWQLHEIALKATNAFVAGHGKWDEDLKNIPQVYLSGKGSFLVAELGGEIVGMGALRFVSEETAEIKRMRVLPKYQGKGLGTNLLKHLEEKAKELGFKRLILDTSTRQEIAVHLYDKFGYTECKRGMLGGLETIYMEKRIA